MLNKSKKSSEYGQYHYNYRTKHVSGGENSSFKMHSE